MLRRKVRRAPPRAAGVDRRAGRAPARPGRAAPARRSHRAVIARCPDRHLHGRPARAGRAAPEAPRAARDRHADRPAHAGRLHRARWPRAWIAAASLTGQRSRGRRERSTRARALLAPGGRHLRLTSDGRTTLSDEPALGGLRPRADLLIEDAARVYGERMLLVVLTGMGNDGLAGAKEVRRRGGRILAEAEDSCTVYGMPRAIVEARPGRRGPAAGRARAAIRQEASADERDRQRRLRRLLRRPAPALRHRPDPVQAPADGAPAALLLRAGRASTS